MGAITPAVLEKGLAARDGFVRKPVYLIFGDDQRRVAELAGRLKDRIVAELGEESYFRYLFLPDPKRPQVGEGTSVAEIVAQLNTVAMFGGGKVALVGPLVSVAAEWQKELAAYAANPNPTSTLILAVAPPRDDRKGGAGLEGSPLAKAIAAGGGEIVKVVPPTAAEVARWAAERFAQKGVSIPKEVAALLVDLSGTDTERVAGEIDKLVAYVGDAAAVTREDVESTVGDHKQKSVFSFIDALRRRNLAAAVDALASLTAQNVPSQQILKLIGTELLRLWAVIDGRRRNLPSQEVAAQMGIPEYMLKGAQADAGRWDENRIRLALNEVMAATLDPMRSGLPDTAALTRLTFRLCSD
ncbi:MAG: DNA polymerase III subunit delta [Nitrospinae bacterium]|nr:DNA polymerase III subunit delta [Nitrospinota bacterium]